MRQKLHVGEGCFEHLVTAPMVPVPMRVDDIDHWFVCEFTNLGENGFASCRCATGVEHDYTLVSNNGDGVSSESDIAIRRGSEEIHALRNFGGRHFAIIGAPAMVGESTKTNQDFRDCKLKLVSSSEA